MLLSVRVINVSAHVTSSTSSMGSIGLHVTGISYNSRTMVRKEVQIVLITQTQGLTDQVCNYLLMTLYHVCRDR